ncbi:uncharacterized protein si:ch211-214j8.12 [Cololabis saira]|uniref:uncharacterized protein si:ch211-214j8.12 n=1 Tax=Cololabis saira TaxID=129043 RepID=UPI002AD51BAC|nr:uncharacterized protein si:ch211-214j8.12 [Cololabis saira]XP_061584910.1 uncharacterized protein si:ch211-214j8.12 [Cololabis saira]
MPLFRALDHWGKAQQGWRRQRKMKHSSSWRTDENGSVRSLTHMCLQSVADNMKEVWVKDYADNYLDQYSFTYIMGPFNVLPGDLVEELTCLLCSRKELSRAALHLLLVPQLRSLSLDRCPGLVTPALCTHVAARCQGLCSLDLSGAQQLPSRVLCETLHSLPALRSLSLAGLPCDRSVILTVVRCCRFLRHLDVSRCHLLSPAALLPLGGGPLCSPSVSPSGLSSVSCSVDSSSLPPNLSPLPLSSLLAMDIGFGEQEGDPVVGAAYLLLSLPSLERVAMDQLGQACRLIERRDFDQADEFAAREGVPRLKELWRERVHRQHSDGGSTKKKGTPVDKDESEEEERIFWEGEECDIEEDASNEGASCSYNQIEEEYQVLSQSDLILNLRNVTGVTCNSLKSLGQLCPGIKSMSVNMDACVDASVGRSQGSLLATGIQSWAGKLQSLSLIFPNHMWSLLLALEVAGTSLTSLTLEGVKTCPSTPLMKVLRACPRLRELLISAEPPNSRQVERMNDLLQHEDDQLEDQDLPKLPDLHSLTLSFSYDHTQKKPAMSWMSLRKVLGVLLNGSTSLEKISLVSLPCPLDFVLMSTLLRGHHFLMPCFANSAGSSPLPLQRVQYIELMRTDVCMTTLRRILWWSKRLEYMDVSCCWQINKSDWLDCKKFSKVQVVWE